MATSMIPIQLPSAVYARLQSLAAQEHTDPAALIDRLVATGSSAFAGIITTDPQLRDGRPVVAGAGITVRTIVGHYHLGLTPEQIADQLEIDLALIYAALAYYHLHRAEIDGDVQANSEQAVQQGFEQA